MILKTIIVVDGEPAGRWQDIIQFDQTVQMSDALGIVKMAVSVNTR